MYYCILQLYEFHKSEVPETQQEKEEFAVKLNTFGVSLSQYASTLEMDNITMSVTIRFMNILDWFYLRITDQRSLKLLMNLHQGKF